MPTAMAVAIAIAAPERRGRAASLVISGLTVATVLGVPLGTWVGSHFGWRSTFVMVAALGAVALAGLLLGLPRGLPRTAATLGQRLAVARHPEVLKTLAVTCMWGLGGFTSFTYLAVPLHRLGFDANGISLALLVFGVAAAIGNTLGGAMSDRIGPLRTSTLGLIGMMLSLTLQSVALTFAPPATAGVLFLVFIFTQGIAGWMYPDHRRRTDRHRPGLRIRLFRHTGLQGAEGGRLPRHPRQFQPGHDHDRPGTGRRHLYRADHPEVVAKIIAKERPTRCCRPWAARPRSTPRCRCAAWACSTATMSR
jgi:MFS family permease